MVSHRGNRRQHGAVSGPCRFECCRADVSDAPILIANAGHDYYINDSSTVGDIFTTSTGNNANSGKSPDQPMASLAALLAAYDLDPGDVVHVDTGRIIRPAMLCLRTKILA